MSTIEGKKVIHKVLEETRYAYGISAENDHLNSDYADYASAQALADFRKAFGNPDLTPDQLAQLLRMATSRARTRQCKTPWAMFVANYLERNDNGKSHIRG